MRGRPLVLSIILSVLLGGIVFGVLKSDLFGDDGAEVVAKKNAVTVPGILPLEKTEIPVVIGVNGRVFPERKVVIKPVVSGTIEEIHFEVDQEVKKDQVLLRIHNRLQSIDLADQEAVLESRKLEADMARRDLKRKERLHGDGHVSEEDLEAAQLKVQTSAINLTRQSEAVKRAEKVLSYYEVKAPWAGVIVQKHVTIGTYVRVGDPVAELLDPDKMQIEIGLTEEAMLQLRRGKEAGSLSLESTTGSLEIEDVRMVLEATPVTRTYPVRFLVRNQKENPVYPGMSVRLTVHTGVQERGFHVPADTLVTRADRTYLWMVKNGRATLVPVRVVGRHGDRIRVEGDFQEGERVILAGGRELKDGQEIDFAPAAVER